MKKKIALAILIALSGLAAGDVRLRAVVEVLIEVVKAIPFGDDP